jgi:hypothetical protein
MNVKIYEGSMGPLKNKLFSHEIAMRVNLSQTENDNMAIPSGH